MTCAKREVTAIVIGVSGRHYVGQNTCRNPQAVCPRTDGEGYEKCKTVCRQIGHAEEMAIAEAGEDAFGGRIVVAGHVYVCRGCTQLLRSHRINAVSVCP